MQSAPWLSSGTITATLLGASVTRRRFLRLPFSGGGGGPLSVAGPPKRALELPKAERDDADMLAAEVCRPIRDWAWAGSRVLLTRGLARPRLPSGGGLTGASKWPIELMPLS